MDAAISKSSLVQFIKFGLVGASSAVVSMSVYSASVWLGAHYIAANALAFALSVLNAFFWNSRFVFKEREGEKRNWPLALAKTYATYAVTGLFLQSLLLFLFIDKLGCGKYLAQFLCVAINTPINFLLNKFWAFKAAKKGACEEAAL